jgi:hypothetical protein
MVLDAEIAVRWRTIIPVLSVSVWSIIIHGYRSGRKFVVLSSKMGVRIKGRKEDS